MHCFTYSRNLNNYTLIILSFLLLLVSCTKEEDAPENIDDFFKGASTSATNEDLVGVWAIFSAKHDGKIIEIPITYTQCGRDFFVYNANGEYTEYLYSNDSCEPDVNQLTWKLNNGIITLANNIGQSDEFVITNLSDQELVFNSSIDVDEDGELDVISITAKRYEPAEFDFTTNSFGINNEEEFEDVLSFTWNAYEGFNSFDRYEIYRSSGENCTKANAELIATITDVEVIEYTDLNPPGAESLCYYFKVYTDQGLLGESNYIGVNPAFFIYIDPIALNDPIVNDINISLTWEPSNSPYFSHYVVTVSNYDGTSASGAQEYILAEIDNINTTSFIDENPPYLENPYYLVHAYNIFGNKSHLSDNVRTGVREVQFKRKEVIDYKRIISFDVDSEEPIVYLYGQLSGNGITEVNLRRFNYETSKTEAISDIPPQVETYSGIKVFNSNRHGKELVIQQGNELHFYDANTMEFKYAIDPDGVFLFSNFMYNQNLDLWVLVSNRELYILKRDNTNLTLISSGDHYPSPQGNSGYELFNLSNQRILVGHFFEPNSIVFNLDTDGNIVDSQFVDFGIGIENDDKTLLNQQANYLLDIAENRLYSTDTFSSIDSFEFPSFPTGCSIDGNLILGTNNDSDWQIEAGSPHKKEAVIYNRISGQVDEISTIGYPHFIFEDYKGDFIGISSGFKKKSLEQNINGKADIFIEKINF
ncbi:MAG: lipocalin family protein [Maribacter stanieri]